MMDFKRDITRYCQGLSRVLRTVDKDEIMRVAAVMKAASEKDNTIFTMGNGGSGSTALHMVCDFYKGTFAGGAQKFKVMCLNENLPLMSAIANDMRYDAVFEEQLKQYLQPGDVVIGFSTRGNSENIIRAIRYANQKGAITVGFCGFDGGRLRKIVQHPIFIRCHDMKITEDVHSIIGHILVKVLAGV